MPVIIDGTSGITTPSYTLEANSVVSVGNSTVNTAITSDTISIGNSSVNTIIHSTGITANGANIHSINASSIASGTINIDRISNSSLTGTKLAANAANENIGYVPVNKAGDTMTGGLVTSGGISLDGTGDLTLNRTDGFNFSIVMPANMDDKSLYFQKAGGGKLNNVQIESNSIYANGPFRTNTRSISGTNFYLGNMIADSGNMGPWHGMRSYLINVNNPSASGVSGKIVIQRSTDWNDWNSEGFIIVFQANGYSGGGISKFYWRLGYFGNSLVQLYHTGQTISSSSITVSGANQVSGAPSDCQYFNLSIDQGAYEYSSLMVLTNLDPVSSITSYRQFLLRNG